jgi:hypothetical protein
MSVSNVNADIYPGASVVVKAVVAGKDVGTSSIPTSTTSIGCELGSIQLLGQHRDRLPMLCPRVLQVCLVDEHIPRAEASIAQPLRDLLPSWSPAVPRKTWAMLESWRSSSQGREFHRAFHLIESEAWRQRGLAILRAVTLSFSGEVVHMVERELTFLLHRIRGMKPSSPKIAVALRLAAMLKQKDWVRRAEKTLFRQPHDVAQVQQRRPTRGKSMTELATMALQGIAAMTGADRFCGRASDMSVRQHLASVLVPLTPRSEQVVTALCAQLDHSVAADDRATVASLCLATLLRDVPTGHLLENVFSYADIRTLSSLIETPSVPAIVIATEAFAGDAATWLKRLPRPSCLPPLPDVSDETVMSAFIQATLGIAHMHALGISHFDCHFANVLVRRCRSDASERMRIVSPDRRWSIEFPRAGVDACLWDFGYASGPTFGRTDDILKKLRWEALGRGGDLCSDLWVMSEGFAEWADSHSREAPIASAVLRAIDLLKRSVRELRRSSRKSGTGRSLTKRMQKEFTLDKICKAVCDLYEDAVLLRGAGGASSGVEVFPRDTEPEAAGLEDLFDDTTPVLEPTETHDFGFQWGDGADEAASGESV